MSRTPETINARENLVRLYGPDSIACDTVRIIDEKYAEAQFRVGQNLCGPKARPPMFKRLVSQEGIFTTTTHLRDAWQHFNRDVGISVVSAHNITGLVAEGLSQGEPFHVLSYDYLRFRKPVLPGQRISYFGTVERSGVTASATLTMIGERRPFTRNFQVEIIRSGNRHGQERLLAQHWLLEHFAQGLGIFGLHFLEAQDVVPLLMECGESKFARIPIYAGDTLTTRMTVLSADTQQIFGNAITFIDPCDGNQITTQQELLLQFLPMQEAKAILKRRRLQ